MALILLAASSAANSANGLLLRSVQAASEWQLVFYRSISLAVALSIVYLCIHRRDWRVHMSRLSTTSWLGALALSLTNIGFIWAVQHTTVANTMFMLGAIPFFTAILARIFLSERASRGLWFAVTTAIGGVAVMVWEGLGAGTLFGNGLALMTAIAFASYVVILRHGRTTDMLPVVILGAWLSVLIASVLTGLDLRVSLHDAGLMIFWGAVLSALVHFLFTYGARYVQGAELSLMALLEFGLAPIWVLLVFGERPSVLTLLGGALVVTAVIGHAVTRLGREVGKGTQAH